MMNLTPMLLLLAACGSPPTHPALRPEDVAAVGVSLGESSEGQPVECHVSVVVDDVNGVFVHDESALLAVLRQRHEAGDGTLRDAIDTYVRYDLRSDDRPSPPADPAAPRLPAQAFQTRSLTESFWASAFEDVLENVRLRDDDAARAAGAPREAFPACLYVDEAVPYNEVARALYGLGMQRFHPFVFVTGVRDGSWVGVSLGELSRDDLSADERALVAVLVTGSEVMVSSERPAEGGPRDDLGMVTPANSAPSTPQTSVPAGVDAASGAGPSIRTFPVVKDPSTGRPAYPVAEVAAHLRTLRDAHAHWDAAVLSFDDATPYGVVRQIDRATRADAAGALFPTVMYGMAVRTQQVELNVTP
jgi:hypothetical protein